MVRSAGNKRKNNAEGQNSAVAEATRIRISKILEEFRTRDYDGNINFSNCCRFKVVLV